MHHRIDSGERVLDRGLVDDVADDGLGRGQVVLAEDALELLAAADQTAHLVPRLEQRHRRVGAHETRRTRDQNSHGRPSLTGADDDRARSRPSSLRPAASASRPRALLAARSTPLHGLQQCVKEDLTLRREDRRVVEAFGQDGHRALERESRGLLAELGQATEGLAHEPQLLGPHLRQLRVVEPEDVGLTFERGLDGRSARPADPDG